ncbi:BQ2448_5349 [Microbotryum intermedium]|uniref:Calnexin n=1 Tax=Microbotryum intermedium TaxID=269621 RepID=A0A238F982_9BASI|nr:BQ2448_5349 [Microbotryum intermedium]
MRFITTWLVLATSASQVLASGPVTFTPSTISGHFVEQFTSGWSERWRPSKATKQNSDKDAEVFSYIGEWKVEEPSIFPGISGDEGLVMKSKAAHHGISALFDKPLDPKGKTLVVQYEVKLQNGLDCGGAYLKLLSDSAQGIQAEEFSDATPYTIMFGPDKCGSTSKVHFIFRHKNPVTGAIEEKHLKAPPSPVISRTSNLYTLIVRPDQSVEIKINGESSKNGTLLTDFSPAVNPPKEIDDEIDVKPKDWVDSPKIADPTATKPEDWDEDAPETIEDADATKPDDWYEDEPAQIPDPDAEQPEEWSSEDDGDWEAPMIPNPKCDTASGCGPWKRPTIANPAYKGKWFAPLIDNPLYKGPWSPRKIANPAYFEDKTPSDFTPMSGIGFELWTMTDDILFDNIYIGDSEALAEQFAAETYKVKVPIETSAEGASALKEDEEEVDPLTSERFTRPVWSKNPIGFGQFHLQRFMDKAVEDPVGAFKTMPVVGASIAAAFAGLVGLLTVVFASILPSSSTVQETKKAVKSKAEDLKKKTDAVTEDVKDKADEAAQVIEDKKDEAKEGVRTRARKSAAVEDK